MFTDSDKPKTLTESEIMELQKKHGIVLFYMDGCRHCEAMKPAWNKVIDELKEKHKDEIILGAIESGDMDMFKKSGISPSVSGFPTILYFHPNNISRNDMYSGDRSYEDLKKWILDKKDNKRTSNVNKMKKGIKGINSMEKSEFSQSGGARKSRRSRGRKIRKYTMKKSRKYRKSHNRKHTKRQHRK